MTNKKILTLFVVIIIFCSGLMLILANLLILRGRLDERASKICAGTYEIQSWEKSIDNVSKLLEENKNTCDKQIDEAKAEAEKWRNNYLWLKKQVDEQNKITN